MFIKFIIIVFAIFCMFVQASGQIIDTTINWNHPDFNLLKKINLGKSEITKYFFEHDTLGVNLNKTDTAYVKTYFGTIEIIIYYRAGKKNRVIGYYDNGNKFMVSNFRNFQLNGINFSYYKNGNKQYMRYFEDGNIFYPIISWYESGELESILNINDSSGRLESIEFYPNQNIKRKVLGLNSDIHPIDGGPFTETLYYANCIIMEEATYNLGAQVFTQYYKNGIKMLEGKIFNWVGDQIGIWKEWYENGKEKRVYRFHEQIPNWKEGSWKWWDESGNLIKEELYKDNILMESYPQIKN